jgi:hypothetical protein
MFTRVRRTGMVADRLVRALALACVLLGVSARVLPEPVARAPADVRTLLGAATCHDDGGIPGTPAHEEKCPHCPLCQLAGHLATFAPGPAATTWAPPGTGTRISFVVWHRHATPREPPRLVWPRGPPALA